MQVGLIKDYVTVKKGDEEKHYTNFYVVLPNGYTVAVKPVFDKDYKVLIGVADKKE